MFHVIIIGNGPAGCGAATYVGRGNRKTLMLTGVMWGGHLTTTTTVYNYIGYPQVDGLQLMELMMQQAKEAEVIIREELAIKVNFHKEEDFHEVITSEGNIYRAPILIIATGAKHKHLPLPKNEEFRNCGVYHCATCDGTLFRYDETPVIVVGGGNTALTEALYLSSICKKIIIVHRRDKFRGEPFLINQVLQKSNIEIKWDTEITELKGDKNLKFITILNKKTQVTTIIETRALFIAIGFEPNTKMFENNHLALLEGGYIKVDNHQKTNIKGVYAAGDVCDFQYRQAITAAGDGAKAAMGALAELSSMLINS